MLGTVGRVTPGIEAQHEVIAPVASRVRYAGRDEDGISSAEEPHQGSALPGDQPNLGRAVPKAVDMVLWQWATVDRPDPEGIQRRALEHEQE